MGSGPRSRIWRAPARPHPAALPEPIFSRRKVLRSFSGEEIAAGEAALLAQGNEDHKARRCFSPEKPCLPLSTDGMETREVQRTGSAVKNMGLWQVFDRKDSIRKTTNKLRNKQIINDFLAFWFVLIARIIVKCLLENKGFPGKISRNRRVFRLQKVYCTIRNEYCGEGNKNSGSL